MAANKREDPVVVIEGIENVIERDLLRERSRLGQTTRDRQSWKDAISHEVQRKRNWKGLIGTGKYDDDRMREAIGEINENIRALSSKVAASEEKIAWHKKIIDKLEKDLIEQRALLEKLRQYRAGSNGNTN